MNFHTADTLLVVLDPNFGDKLRDVWPGCPVWITSGSGNDSVIKDLLTKHPNENYLFGLNILTHYKEKSPDERFLSYLDTIEQHQGTDSTSTPYRKILVYGVPLTENINKELEGLGLEKVRASSEYFEFERKI